MDLPVLTYDVNDVQALNLVKEIGDRKLHIWTCAARGIVTDLRVEGGDYVRGISKIRQHINKSLKLQPPL